MKALAAAGLCALTLAGCAGSTSITPDSLSFANLSTDLRRTAEVSYLDQAFADGTVHVVAEERGEMKTYILIPCRGGTHICGESLRGRAGHLTKGPDFVQVTGAYAGRTFFLRPGGSGVLRRGGHDTPLAWE